MEKITSTAGLKNAIQLLETEQDADWQLLKEQFSITSQIFDPVNFLKSTFNNKGLSSFLIENILGTTMGIATGYLSKRIVVGTSVSIFRKLLGSALQLGVAKFIAQHTDTIRFFGQSLIKNVFLKKGGHSGKL